jgi:small subunit ribosomal protein S6
MTLSAPTYDLVLLLDPQAEEATRAKIVADASKAIEAQGELLRHNEWGDRALAYPIDHKSGAEYHLLQFHATPELLSTLNRTLRITDEVVRFRVIKLAPGTPDAPEVSAVGEVAQRIEAEPEVEVAAAVEVTAGEPA